ncbi:hypothetical protein H8959_005898 [Pygathrix nigripes]
MPPPPPPRSGLPVAGRPPGTETLLRCGPSQASRGGRASSAPLHRPRPARHAGSKRAGPASDTPSLRRPRPRERETAPPPRPPRHSSTQNEVQSAVSRAENRTQVLDSVTELDPGLNQPILKSASLLNFLFKRPVNFLNDQDNFLSQAAKDI